MSGTVNLTGRTLGDYEILGILGRGGMAIVYKARQLSLDRWVALKVLLPEFASDKPFVERFIREARSAASLRHPNIVHIHDINEIEDIRFFGMEYVEGHTLSEILQTQGPMLPERIVHIACQVMSALACAHAQQIIHRDIKSSNIMIDSSDRITVTDFGLAKPMYSHGVTQTGTLIGTPEYMSPEQCLGKDVDERTDLYSLGVVMYEMITGKIPFESNTLPGIVHKQVYEQPRPIEELLPQTPQKLVKVVHKLLEKRKEDRYQTAEAVLRDLQEGSRPTPFPSAIPGPAIKDMETVVAETHFLEELQESQPRASWAKWFGLGIPVLILAALGATLWSRTSQDPGPIPFISTPTPIPEKTAIPTRPTETPTPQDTTWRILVHSQPEGAALWIDGQDTGKKTPAELDMTGQTGDKHEIRLQLDGHTETTVSLTLEEEMEPFHVVLARKEPTIKPGSIILEMPWATEDSGVQILLDGRKQTLSRGKTILKNLSPGKHTLTVKCIKPYVNHTQTIEVSSEEETPVDLDFRFAKLFANASPWCNLIVQGQDLGVTPIRDHPIAPGEYDIEFRSGTGEIWKASRFHIKEGLDVNLHNTASPFNKMR